MKIYLASHFGFNDSMKAYMKECKAKLEEVCEVLNPWELVEEQEILDAINANDGGIALANIRCKIGLTNAHAIEDADILVANLDGQDLDDGVCAEIGYACALSKATYAWRTDVRQCGELGGPFNLQVEAFVTGGVFRSLDALCEQLKADIAFWTSQELYEGT
jgi:nucleoside 2-deoxyribosyltransferase